MYYFVQQILILDPVSNFTQYGLTRFKQGAVTLTSSLLLKTSCSCH